MRPDVVLVAPAKHLLADFEEAFPGLRTRSQVMPNGVRRPPPSLILEEEGRQGVAWYARGGSVKSSQAFLDIAEQCPDLTFTVFGQADDLVTGSHVINEGWVTEPYRVLGKCRILLNTSPTEGMPNTALQAITAGMFVVGPPNAGLQELQRKYPDHVLLVDLSDLTAVVSTIRSLHELKLPGQYEVPRSDEVSGKWLDLLKGRT